MRDYVRGDELRHISWTATARRGKLTTRQYQIERDQTILIALDAGRLMTARIEQETKLDSAVHATLALFSAAARAGDNAGLVVFGRRIKSYLAAESRARSHRSRARSSVRGRAGNDRAFVSARVRVHRGKQQASIAGCFVDRSGRRRRFERVADVASHPAPAPFAARSDDRRQRSESSCAANAFDQFAICLRSQSPKRSFIIVKLRCAWLNRLAGLALDVTAAALAPALLETYLRVKERGLL